MHRIRCSGYEHIFDAGASYYDIKVSGADASDSVTVNLFYRSTITGSAENKLRLTYFSGTAWVPVHSSGNTNPMKITTDNLDGTVSGGRFTVVFDNTSTPKLTQLNGTVFALANTTPVVAVNGAAAPVSVGTATSVGIHYQAVGSPDTQTIAAEWDDGSVSSAVSAATGGTSATHTYATAGVYLVRVTVTDANGDSGTGQFQYIVIYDPNGGFVTGGGWINAPAGALPEQPALVGKASFGFVSNYGKGAIKPTGETEFQFNVANFGFHSASYEWLVVSGAKAQYKGIGTVNGVGNYGFLLTATDGNFSGGGGLDRFRIKIWDKNNNGAIVYDNMPTASDDINSVNPQAIAGGSILIHK